MRGFLFPICKIITIIDPSEERFWWYFCPLWKAAKHFCLFSDEEYTWVLTPEKLRYGVGTYYVTAVLDKSKEGTQRTPTLLSVVTAVTQCYFWDSLNSMWKSSGCQVRSCPPLFFFLTLFSLKYGEGSGTPLQYSCLESHGRRSLVGCSPWGR